jgi:hypothetical protein
LAVICTSLLSSHTMLTLRYAVILSLIVVNGGACSSLILRDGGMGKKLRRDSGFQEKYYTICLISCQCGKRYFWQIYGVIRDGSVQFSCIQDLRFGKTPNSMDIWGNLDLMRNCLESKA